LEGVYTKDARFIAFEFSARIVAGTNLYVSGSQYSDFIFQNGMSMGRRIALEIKNALKNRKLEAVLT
jgi:5-formaminoimidazole-4-carboxamide-1-(beta)-D-ribofuranosyl 5'-monophosphate synthetase